MEKREMVLLKDKEVYQFVIVGFNDRESYGEVYLTKNDRKTSIYRGSNMKKVMSLAKRESCNLQGR
jgi:predicted membrane GTPase involved in stress response